MDKKALKEIKYLKLYSGFLTLVILSFVIMSFVRSGSKHFKEITAQRINIVGPKGNLRMVISNSQLQSPGRLNGEKLKPRGRPSGIIFFNQKGDEVGGLLYETRELFLSIDQYERDQIMQLQYLGSKSGSRRYGLQFWDRNGQLKGWPLFNTIDSLRSLNYSHKEIAKKLKSINNGKRIGARRMFLGKKRNERVGLFIKDKKGRNRIKIYVDKQGKVQMKFLDKNGNVIPISKLK